jgi:hypothetical protein
MAVQRLTVAYRSRPRPSSSPGAKASTVCPSYLDGELNSYALISYELGFYLYERPALIERDALEHLPDFKGRRSA